MKFYLILFSLFFLSLVGCEQKADVNADKNEDIDSPSFANSHTSENSLDWFGTYTGTMPCASCPGIETTLVLSEEGTYQLTMKYLGEDDPNSISSDGSFNWNDAGNTITLEDEDPPNQFFVGENYLAKLDMDGNRISGELSEKYVLRKE